MIMTHLRSTHLCVRTPDLSISVSVQKAIPTPTIKRSLLTSVSSRGNRVSQNRVAKTSLSSVKSSLYLRVERARA